MYHLPLSPSFVGRASRALPMARKANLRTWLRQSAAGGREGFVPSVLPLRSPAPRWMGSLTCMLYGIAAALTLDEFALWLNLRDVYWEREGRESIEAIAVFAAALGVAAFGGPFLHAAVRKL